MTKWTCLSLCVILPCSTGCGDSGSEACHSPSSNLSSADKPGALGCACNPSVDQDVCIQGKGLMCTNGRWQAVIDGPCMPLPRWDAAVEECPIVLDSGLDGVSRADAPAGATEDVSSCYSPTSDLSLAEQPGATGCACNPAVDRDVCVRGMGLMCMNGRWQLLIDGPCMPSPDDSSHPETNAVDASVDAAVPIEADAATERASAEAGSRCGDSTCQPGGTGRLGSVVSTVGAATVCSA
jgi:hypothetical protein